MQHLNDFPKRDRNHRVERLAITAFEGFLRDSKDFFIQSQDVNDYGVDYQLEITVNGQATNIRLFVQLKGTEQELNFDGSISISVNRANLNYLLMHPYSFYVCFHAPTKLLKICFAENILRNYEQSGKNWSEQETLTVKFVDDISESRLHEISELLKLNALATRDARINIVTNPIENVAEIISKTVPKIHIPEDKKLVQEMLTSLYDHNHDEIISANFHDFLAILGAEHPAMIFPYMSEINKGMDGMCHDKGRIIDGIQYLRSRLSEGKLTKGSLYYSIGNGFTALKKENEAIQEYKNALEYLSDDNQLTAQCYRNLGGSYSALGEENKALDCYQKALKLDPNLSEANYAVGVYYNRKGSYALALEYFDAIIFSHNTPNRLVGVVQWRINTLFNLNDYRSAYREINTLLSGSENKDQLWKWCLMIVATFCRTSTISAKLSLPFWERFLNRYPHNPDASRELLLAKNFLRMNNDEMVFSYDDFKKEFELCILDVKYEDTAFLWDRLGHWAQDEDKWLDAESCFRKAYNIDGGEYGYCLGVVLNHLGRFKESLPLLLEQAEKIQPDDFSWFQVAISYEFQGRILEAIEAYEKCLSLNEKNELALFNLGGLHWNNDNLEEASRVWKLAVMFYPEHELAHKLLRDIPFILI
ncbi:tetratricopeptide repeat protein [Xenorhabdus griffiniae]|uniref:Tetratricopeptide repeat protein n=1 Tax=Xenorhabdus griffiniae TaxID=351672 RepID=A0ABY9XKH3_9GAMM|nr:tetratricopeptide repeat protein [Xenorhabdus griffiniae]MBD1229384.1 tetratricopeptide repeat protein [Xenorhabdus griffiniae]MBE8589073.1 tetratricopeptide repeat protein [Xenorhabdus griffiniae]WMV73434.1 tetratricopeptide repeat protein [Xenorhabdus griffiniae]WNH03113.1 tetratricopeptide repeat protein [Xenorhabdus griffiniae]